MGLNPGAIGMLIFGIVTLYIFGLGWGFYRAKKKAQGKKRSLLLSLFYLKIQPFSFLGSS